MARIQYLKGDATIPIGEGPKILVHCCNNIGGWGRGFVLALSKRWAEPEKRYREWHRDRKCSDRYPLDSKVQLTKEIKFELGAVQFIEVEVDLWVGNIIGQHGTNIQDGRAPIRYPAIRKGFIATRQMAAGLGATVHMPRMGAGLAGGLWANVEALVNDNLCKQGVPVCAYDL